MAEMNDNEIKMLIGHLREYVELNFERRDKADAVADQALRERLAGMNEIREAMRDQARHFASCESLSVVQDQVSELRRWRSAQEGKASQSSVFLATILAVLGVLIGVMSLLLNLVK